LTADVPPTPAFVLCFRGSRRGAHRVLLVTPWRELPARVRLSEHLDDDALFELCALNRELRIERNADGELIIMAPTGGETGNRNFALTGQLWAWVKKDGTGRGFDSSTGFILPNGAERAPDAAWVRNALWLAVPAEKRRRFPPVCPTFVAKLLSPSDDVGAAHAKMREYLENGAELGWLIDADRRIVWVYRPDGSVERLSDPATVAGDPVLPGFVLDLSEIW
jgi:Uma2 family endonuclease